MNYFAEKVVGALMPKSAPGVFKRDPTVSLEARRIVVWGAPRGRFSAKAVYGDVMSSFHSTEFR